MIATAANYIATLYSEVFMAASFPNDWSITYCTVGYRDADDSLVRLRVSDALAGTGPGSPSDAQVAYLVNWGTGDPRRGGKPRSYIPGVTTETLADSAFLESDFVNTINSNLITFLEAGPGLPIPCQLVEMSFRDGNAWRDTAVTYPIIGGTLNPVTATQRRRVDRLRPS